MTSKGQAATEKKLEGTYLRYLEIDLNKLPDALSHCKRNINQILNTST